MKTWFDLYASERTRRVPRPTRAAAVLTLAATFGFFLSGPAPSFGGPTGIAQMVYAVAALGAINLLVRSMI